MNNNIPVYAKYDLNGYPYATVLVDFFNEDMHGILENWILTDTNTVKTQASNTTPFEVEG